MNSHVLDANYSLFVKVGIGLKTYFAYEFINVFNNYKYDFAQTMNELRWSMESILLKSG